MLRLKKILQQYQCWNDKLLPKTKFVKAVYWWYYLIYFLRGFLGYQIDRYIWIDSNDRINAICKKLEIVRLFNDIKFIKDILNCKGCKSLG